jgi:hypothetical protein
MNSVVSQSIEISEELWLTDDDKSLARGCRYEGRKKGNGRLGARSVFVEFLQ